MFSSLVAIAVDLRRTVAMFFIVALNAGRYLSQLSSEGQRTDLDPTISVCIVSAGESIGIIFNTVFSSSTGFALNITSTVLSIGTFMAGMLSPSQFELTVPTTEPSFHHRSRQYQHARLPQGSELSFAPKVRRSEPSGLHIPRFQLHVYGRSASS